MLRVQSLNKLSVFRHFALNSSRCKALARRVSALLSLFSMSLFGLVLLSNLTQAMEVKDLYQTSVVVENQSRQARAAAHKEALSKLFVKISGQHSVLENSEVKKAIRGASQYVRKFEFNRDEDGNLTLQTDFDEAKLNKLLRQEALPIWGKRRPAILLWMAGEDAQTMVRHVISRESYNHLRKQVLAISKDRGLPIIFPLYDLQDNQSVSVSDVWGYFYHHIAQFSNRYEADAIVIARFRHVPKDALETSEQQMSDMDDMAVSGEVEHTNEQDTNWNLQWRVYENDSLVKVNSIDGHLTDVLEQLVHTMADGYASQYAVDSANLANASSITLTVHGVGDIKHLMAAEQLLTSFSAVADVTLENLRAEVAKFKVTLVGEPLDLVQGMALEQHFEEIFDPLNDDRNKINTDFRWVP